MSRKELIHELLTKADRRFLFCSEMGLLNWMPDEIWIQKMWIRKKGEYLDFNNLRGFNEKLQWIKLYDHNPLYTELVDKVAVRNNVKDRVGGEILVPSIGVWDSPDDINFSKLPTQFVLKCNHNSGEGMFICHDKSTINVSQVKKRLKRALHHNYYYNLREWAYKDVKPRILGEQYLENADKQPLIDYKFYCFNGEPKFLYVGEDHFINGKKRGTLVTYLNMDFKPVTFERPDHDEMKVIPAKPLEFDKMVEISRKLSENIPFVRVDLYWINGKIYFSEMTLYPGGGYGFFIPDSAEQMIGDMLKLPCDK